MHTSFFANLLKSKLGEVEAAINENGEFNISSDKTNVHFAIKSGSDHDDLHVRVRDGVAHVSLEKSPEALFTLSARREDWEQFFAPVPKAPYQSYWGILRILGHHEGVQLVGDVFAFGQNARVWRLTLDVIRETINGSIEMQGEDDDTEDALIGRYIWIDCPNWGKSKIFVESSGEGPQPLLFLHTAGVDSRQYHSLMNDKGLRQKCTMYAFDLPGHGRSGLGSKQLPEGHVNDEEAYVGTIRLVIEKLKLKKPIVCGASMAGHVCLALAIRAEEVGVGGVIPCEGCDHLPLNQPIYELTGDEAILNPERVCGMISPTTPAYYKRLFWWNYSSQGAKIFPGDLKFYFRGWDGRGRVEKIDTKLCPVFMITGEYDYSCTPAASAMTAKKIPGAVFETMQGLGHFPATENPPAFIPYLLKGIEHIQEKRRP